MKAKSIIEYYLNGNTRCFDALAKAFDLGDLKSFRKGNFILQRDGAIYNPLLFRMFLEINTLNQFSEHRKFEISETSYLDLQPFFESGLHFLKIAYGVEEKLIAATGGGWEQHRGIKGYGISLTSNTVKSFTNAESKVQLQKILEIIIDPTETDIPMDIMIKEFGYPDENPF